jgi:pimeloyl-ACP methyl ester carboxylesterase
MAKPPLLLLHGALGTGDQFASLLPHLEADFQLHRLDFEGHGSRPSPHDTFHNDNFVANVRDYLHEQNLSNVDIFGYSLGGYVACTLAHSDPTLVKRIVTLSTKFLWDEATVRREVKLLDVETIKAKVPQFAQTLAARHVAEGWEKVVNRTQDLLWSNTETGGLTPEFMAALPHPIRLIVGDRDHTVSLSESVTIYQALAQGQFEVLPNTPHPFEKVSSERLAVSLREFFG